VNAPTHFLCNICGAGCERGPEAPSRESISCPACKSTVRLRSLALLLSREIFEADLTLPEFPKVPCIRGAGLSDPPELASRLARKLDYTNTFFHQAPRLDITKPSESDFGRYDFLIASEVLEHVAPPVEPAFANLARMLKPNGFLLLTVPFSLGPRTVEHYPDLHQYSLTYAGDRPVLVNRKRDGSLEVFDNLVFHGGQGSTLELRLYSQDSLRRLLTGAGFGEVIFFSENVLDFGVEHGVAWSLPILARKGRVRPPVAEIVYAYRHARRLARDLRRDSARIRSDYQQFVEYHEKREKELENQLAARTEWARQIEEKFAERTQWAQRMEIDYQQAVADFEHARQAEIDAGVHIESLQKELADARQAASRLEARKWIKLGRKMGFLT
jgi:SAM-dependent methyltransferase